MALPKKAITILRQVKRLILAEPKLYDQNEFPSAKSGHNCNTPCCIAGWVEWAANPDPKAYNAKLLEKGDFCSNTMAETLGISYKKAQLLFGSWPTCATPAWKMPRTEKAAKDAARHIDRFIRNGGEW
jgi:hypothetical protein